VARDVHNGYVSNDVARDAYGAALNADASEIDEQETQHLRGIAGT
jgi:N-methylhydantoinase B/oxoprolinase/acetone carboxylase alpha subunit